MCSDLSDQETGRSENFVLSRGKIVGLCRWWACPSPMGLRDMRPISLEAGCYLSHRFGEQSARFTGFVGIHSGGGAFSTCSITTPVWSLTISNSPQVCSSPVSDPAAWNRSLGGTLPSGIRPPILRQGSHVESDERGTAGSLPPHFPLTYRNKCVHGCDHRLFCDTGEDSTHDMIKSSIGIGSLVHFRWRTTSRCLGLLLAFVNME